VVIRIAVVIMVVVIRRMVALEAVITFVVMVILFDLATACCEEQRNGGQPKDYSFHKQILRHQVRIGRVQGDGVKPPKPACNQARCRGEERFFRLAAAARLASGVARAQFYDADGQRRRLQNRLARLATIRLTVRDRDASTWPGAFQST